MDIKSLIPNTLSCSNLLCGCASAMFAMNGELLLAAILIVVAAFLDLFDGMVARLLNATSALGEQLDSLADMVSFGVAPGMIVFSILTNVEDGLSWLPFIAFIIPLCSALRLARFNAFKEETDSFIGLATPANSIFWALLIIITFYLDDNFLSNNDHGYYMSAMLNDQGFILSLAIILSLLMVSKIPMFSLKLGTLSWRSNNELYILIVLSAISLILFKMVGLLLIIPLYILISVIKHLFFKAKNEVQSGN